MLLADQILESFCSTRSALLLLLGCLVYFSALLIIPIVRPPIVSYPWYLPNSYKERQRVVVLAGSFNPPHNGHVAMLQYLAKR
jgi:hypothetical protein